MIFDNIALGTEGIIAAMNSHLRLWVRRAPRRVDRVDFFVPCLVRPTVISPFGHL